MEIPDEIAALVDDVARTSGVVAVVLGGSRATGHATSHSDWDIGVYYRGEPDFAAVRARGHLYPPGSWGRVMNGGAWLTLARAKVDVLLRDLDVVDAWSDRAEQGEWELDGLLGYLAGIPTYALLAERSTCRVLAGELPQGRAYPAKLAASAPARWRFNRDFTLDHARSRARLGDVASAVGQVARAVIEEAHARMCERREWVFNEKRLVERAGLGDMHAMFETVPREKLLDWVERAAAAVRSTG